MCAVVLIVAGRVVGHHTAPCAQSLQKSLFFRFSAPPFSLPLTGDLSLFGALFPCLTDGLWVIGSETSSETVTIPPRWSRLEPFPPRDTYPRIPMLSLLSSDLQLSCFQQKKSFIASARMFEYMAACGLDSEMRESSGEVEQEYKTIKNTLHSRRVPLQCFRRECSNEARKMFFTNIGAENLVASDGRVAEQMFLKFCNSVFCFHLLSSFFFFFPFIIRSIPPPFRGVFFSGYSQSVSSLFLDVGIAC